MKWRRRLWPVLRSDGANALEDGSMTIIPRHLLDTYVTE